MRLQLSGETGSSENASRKRAAPAEDAAPELTKKHKADTETAQANPEPSPSGDGSDHGGDQLTSEDDESDNGEGLDSSADSGDSSEDSEGSEGSYEDE